MRWQPDHAGAQIDTRHGLEEQLDLAHLGGHRLVAVNFGDAAASVPASGSLLFHTPSVPDVTPSGVRLPPHAGALLRVDGTAG